MILYHYYFFIKGKNRAILSFRFNEMSRQGWKLVFKSRQCFFFEFLLDQGPFCGATDHPYFGLHVTLPWVLSQGGFSDLYSCLRAVTLRVTSGATPAFFTNSGIHYISIKTAGWPSSYKQRKAGSLRILALQVSLFPLSHTGRPGRAIILFS